MSVKNPFLIPSLRSQFDALPDDEKELVAWIYDYARGDRATILIGVMTGLALEDTEATWLDIAQQAKDRLIR